MGQWQQGAMVVGMLGRWRRWRRRQLQVVRTAAIALVALEGGCVSKKRLEGVLSPARDG